MMGRFALLLGSCCFRPDMLERRPAGAGRSQLVQWLNLVTIIAQEAPAMSLAIEYDNARLRSASPTCRFLLNLAHESDGIQANQRQPRGQGYMAPATPIARPDDSRGRRLVHLRRRGDDADTWPVALQSILGQPVNAGVNGYGIDQIALRARKGHTVHPGVIVVALIHDDLRRAEMSRVWGCQQAVFRCRGRNADPF